MTRMDACDQRELETRTVGRLGFCSLGKGIGWLAVDGSVIGGAGAGSRPGYRARQHEKQRAVIGLMSDPQVCFPASELQATVIQPNGEPLQGEAGEW